MNPDDEPASTAHVAQLHALLKTRAEDLKSYINRQLPAKLRRMTDPDDVVQDTFFEAFRRIAEFVPQEKESTYRWLLTIARHRILNLARIHARPKHGNGEVLSEEELTHGSVLELLQDLAIYEKTPSRSASRRELVLLVEKSIETLQPDYRQAVRFRYIQGLSLVETAVKMQRTTDAAQKLCVRGLKALRTELRTASLYI